MEPPVRMFRVRQAVVAVYADRGQMGRAAGRHGADLLRAALTERGQARIIVACAPSQEATTAALVAAPDIDWSRVEVFHMDEYVGLAAAHPASFRRWLKEHLLANVTPGAVHFLDGEAADLPAECRRYAGLLARAPIDICFLGFGENGHIAFNDPHVADFDDPALVKVATLDDACRAQQVCEGHFPDLAAVPPTALTLTCPALLRAAHLVCSVPGGRKAQAVRRAVTGPRSTTCPASAVFDHPHAWVFLDSEAAALLPERDGPHDGSDGACG